LSSGFVFHDEFDAKVIDSIGKFDKPVEILMPIRAKPNKTTYCMELNPADKWTKIDQKCEDSKDSHFMSCCVDNFGTYAV
jgi:hypothetical protein